MRRLVAAAVVAVLFSSCAPDLSKSSAVVLVPADETFASQWQFEPIDGPDNYQFFVHWSPEFDPDVDPSLTVVGYQVSDLDNFTGQADAEDDATADAVRLHAERSLGQAPFPVGGCTSLSSVQGTLICEYDIGQPELLTISSRRIESATGPTTLVVAGVPERAITYLRGEFEELLPADATNLLR